MCVKGNIEADNPLSFCYCSLLGKTLILWFLNFICPGATTKISLNVPAFLWSQRVQLLMQAVHYYEKSVFMLTEVKACWEERRRHLRYGNRGVINYPQTQAGSLFRPGSNCPTIVLSSHCFPSLSVSGINKKIYGCIVCWWNL